MRWIAHSISLSGLRLFIGRKARAGQWVSRQCPALGNPRLHHWRSQPPPPLLAWGAAQRPFTWAKRLDSVESWQLRFICQKTCCTEGGISNNDAYIKYVMLMIFPPTSLFICFLQHSAQRVWTTRRFREHLVLSFPLTLLLLILIHFTTVEDRSSSLFLILSFWHSFFKNLLNGNCAYWDDIWNCQNWKNYELYFFSITVFPLSGAITGHKQVLYTLPITSYSHHRIDPHGKYFNGKKARLHLF